MRILLIGHESDLNGASRSMLNIIDCLLNKKHEIFVLSSYNSGAFYQEVKKRNVNLITYPFERWCVYLPHLLSRIKWWLAWNIKYKLLNKKTAKKVAEFALENKIDIIHSNTSVINIGALISKYSGIPHVWHIREFGDLDFEMYFYDPKWYVSKVMNQYADRFICISEAIKNHYSYLSNEKKRLVYNGISPASIIPASEKAVNSKPHILIAGRISETKGQHEAVAACELLLKKGMDQFELFLAGSGEAYFKISPEMEKHIHFLGQVGDMNSVRRHIDIELVCSKAEAFGRVTVEGMLAGNPVIGSNTGGTPELINDGVDGFVYEKNNIQQLADKIAQLLNDEELRKKMGTAARQKAEKSFLIERCADEIEQIYYDVLK